MLLQGRLGWRNILYATGTRKHGLMGPRSAIHYNHEAFQDSELLLSGLSVAIIVNEKLQSPQYSASMLEIRSSYSFQKNIKYDTVSHLVNALKKGTPSHCCVVREPAILWIGR